MSMHPTRNLFAEFKGYNRIFIETGSYRGDGIQLALDAGYEKIISIDNDPAAIDFCMNRFDLYNNPTSNIKLVRGDSAECLFDVIRRFDPGMVTYWLDSHWQMFENTPPGPNPFPLLKELNQICGWCLGSKEYPTIIIDDMVIMQPDIAGYSNNDVRARLLDLNPNYKLDYFANPVINNILVAHL